MNEDFNINLKNAAKAILIIGCILSFIIGFIVIVAAYEARKIAGLVIWIVGPLCSLLMSVIFYGVAILKDNNAELKRNNTLLETNGKKLDRANHALKESEDLLYSINKKLGGSDSSDPKEKNIEKVHELRSNFEKLHEEINKSYSTKLDENPKMDPRMDPKMEPKMEPEKDEKVDEDKKTQNNPFGAKNPFLEKNAINKEDIVADYKVNIEDSVLFDNVLTLSNGQILHLEYAYNVKISGSILIFTIDSSVYAIDMIKEYDATVLFNKLNKKTF